jgi:hypothetical protein
MQQMHNNKELDQWDLALEEQIKIVNQCQLDNNLKSCTKCPKILDCITRKQYVKSVYESMSKGAGGGFEF